MFELKRIRKSYRGKYGENLIFRDLSFRFPEKGLIAIKGPSGSGKSTLLNLLAGFEKPDKGSVLYQGKDIASFSPKQWGEYRTQEIAFLPQHFNLLEEESTLWNVMLPGLIAGKGKEEARQRAEALMASQKILSLKDKRVAVLSGGEKQRIALCRALMNDPRAIFADEPTGALDERSAEKAMRSLKEISAYRLVILVSHNEALIKRYSDRILSLENHSLCGVSARKKRFSQKEKTAKNRGYFPLFMLKRHMKEDFGKHLLSFLSFLIGFIALSLSVGFLNGSSKALEAHAVSSLGYPSSILSRKVIHQVEGSPLSIEEKKRPKKEEALEAIAGYEAIVKEDYSYFFPEYQNALLEGEGIGSVSFLPLYDLSLSDRANSFSYRGELPDGADLRFVFVNGAFVSRFGSCIGKSVHVSSSSSVEVGTSSDEISLTFDFVILAEVEEFSFLSSPAVYYSYPALEERVKAYRLDSLSERAEGDVTIASLVSSVSGDSPYGSYGYRIFALNQEASLGIASLRKMLADSSSELEISSSNFEGEESFSSLSSAFSLSLIPFLAIASIGIAFIAGTLAYSSFLKRRKEVAILSSLGMHRRDIRSLYGVPSYLVAFLSIGISIPLSIPAAGLLNRFLFLRTGIPNLLQLPFSSWFGIPLLLPLGLFLFGMMILLVSVSIPLGYGMRRRLVEELRDE